MRAELFQLLGHVDVIPQRILWTAFVENVAGVANGRLTNRAGFENSINCNAHVLNGIERIEDTEDIDALGVRFAHEFLDDVVGIRRIPYSVRAAKQHLETSVRNAEPQLAQTLPRILMQEAQRGVKGGAAPHFDAEKIRKALRHGVGGG